MCKWGLYWIEWLVVVYIIFIFFWRIKYVKFVVRVWFINVVYECKGNDSVFEELIV